jgi:4-diphosphocytidyl-2-C-methyl-D-erythritol kinase
MTATPDPILCPALARKEPIDGGVLWRSPAKINLTLHVGALRPDGYHGLDSIVAKISLYDLLAFRPRGDGKITMRCDGFECGKIEDNLVYRAARLMQERSTAALGYGAGVYIRLEKNIPPGSGLGGGSGDAATTLLALNELWALRLPARELAKLAAEFGSDVPLFLDGPAVHMRGRGEIVQPVCLPPFWAVLYLSELHCATGKVYRAFDEQTAGSGRSIEPLSTPVTALNGKPMAWSSVCVNDLQAPAIEVCPELAEVMRELSRLTGKQVLMTGSGSGLFILADDERLAMTMAERLPAPMRTRVRVACVNSW